MKSFYINLVCYSNNKQITLVNLTLQRAQHEGNLQVSVVFTNQDKLIICVFHEPISWNQKKEVSSLKRFDFVSCETIIRIGGSFRVCFLRGPFNAETMSFFTIKKLIFRSTIILGTLAVQNKMCEFETVPGNIDVWHRCQE